MARSLVDAAAWMATDLGAQAVLAAGVQQRLARMDDLTAIVARNQRLPRRAMIPARSRTSPAGRTRSPNWISPG